FVLWKNTLEKLGRKSLTVTEAKGLIGGKTVRIKGLKSKKGNKYNAMGKLEKYTSGTGRVNWRVALDFSDEAFEKANKDRKNTWRK
ncbi:MAG: hypothetical protein JRC86_13495, partial [Deltaproteobacteria bacterium]|nr:hypothetical protein [Deltaproteobacteria bacterium]